MRKLGLASGYFFTGLMLTLLFLLLNTESVLVNVPNKKATIHYTVDPCQSVQRGRLPPPDRMTLPLYPGCESQAEYEERFFCGLKRLFSFVQDQKQESEGSKKENVVIAFTIDEVSGKMGDLEVRKGSDTRNIREALRIVQLLVDRDVRWTPGTVKGEPTAVRFGIAISFHGAGCGD